MCRLSALFVFAFIAVSLVTLETDAKAIVKLTNEQVK